MKITLASALVCALALVTPSSALARNYHVAVQGNDANPGTRAKPLRTVQRAANLAQPGDTVTVHEGIYRESINPPRGGTSDKERIVYQAGRGETVEIRGSERITNWVKLQNDVWKVTLPNAFFGGFNPYNDRIRGDWFDPKGRPHHTGAVYVNGDWLVEAAALDEVLAGPGMLLAWLTRGGDQYLLNVAWFRPQRQSAERTSASAFSAQKGVQVAACSEGGDCVGWIEDGDSVAYQRVDFGARTEQLEIRAASATDGGVIEIRYQDPKGELLGTCPVPHTGGWQSWSSFQTRIKPLSGTQSICFVFRSPKAAAARTATADTQLWFAMVDGTQTTIWAQFRDADPNREQVEINVRRTVFYPDRPGRNYITVRGFRLRHAATPWAPPTAEQPGLIGTHWSKGWIIEDNIVSHSTCSGIALGKHGDKWDNTSANSAEGYVKTIERAFENGWNRDTIGHHVVRNNQISHCEQAGIVGSLGAAFSTVADNTIHDIHTRRFFTGAEMAGIKFHAAIDTVIRGNHIYKTCLGLWLDWMAQGTRVSANLFHDNDRDLFVEVNHGPFVVDNNLFLSGANLLDVSEGGAFVHNLFLGRNTSSPEFNRETPYHPPHTTTVAGLTNVHGGDCRFYNNIFVGRGAAEADKDAGFGLAMYDTREYPSFAAGNVYYRGARSYARETSALVVAEDPKVTLLQEPRKIILQFSPGSALRASATTLVTTESLGKAEIPGLAYENADGSSLKIDTDFFGKKRSRKHPTAGPFEQPEKTPLIIKAW